MYGNTLSVSIYTLTAKKPHMLLACVCSKCNIISTPGSVNTLRLLYIPRL